MTRFLPDISADLKSGGFNQETERLFAYHQATKHTYHSVRTHAHFLDWANQPNPFRTYEGAPLIALPPEPGFPPVGIFATMAALSQEALPAGAGEFHRPDDIQLDVDWLSRLLWYAMAVSAWKKIPGTGNRYSLRINPSSGNLHPTETYVAALGFAGVDDGLYHYRADRHALELRRQGDWVRDLTRALEIPWASPLIIGLTSIFWREAWKYRDRAYRYCCHDLGHAMMSLLLAARALGLTGGVVAHFSDPHLALMLGLAESDEAPMAFLVFPPQNRTEQSPASLSQSLLGVPNQLSTEEVSYDLLLGMHRSTILPDPVGPLSSSALMSANVQPPLPESLPAPALDAPLGPTVRKRRSALDFDARSPSMRRGEVEQLLDFATRDWCADWRGNFHAGATPAERGADFVTLYLYCHRVCDCDPGVYRWDKSNRKLEQLHRGNVERVAAYLSLEQALAGNACFAVSMIADLAEAARLFGNRGYRYVHFEAGAIGQRLYVGAEALGWNATGMGAFYDDDVHRYLGFLPEGAPLVSAALRAAEQAALVMLGSPSSRAAAHDPNRREPVAVVSESGKENRSDQPLRESKKDTVLHSDPHTLPRQVIYHFAVGQAIPDPPARS